MDKVIHFTDSFEAREVARVLLKSGYSCGHTLGEVRDGAVPDADKSTLLRCAISEDEALEEISDDAILVAAGHIWDGNADAVEEAIGYIRAGELGLARALFPRFLSDSALRAAERALP